MSYMKNSPNGKRNFTTSDIIFRYQDDLISKHYYQVHSVCFIRDVVKRGLEVSLNFFKKSPRSVP